MGRYFCGHLRVEQLWGFFRAACHWLSCFFELFLGTSLNHDWLKKWIELFMDQLLRIAMTEGPLVELYLDP